MRTKIHLQSASQEDRTFCGMFIVGQMRTDGMILNNPEGIDKVTCGNCKKLIKMQLEHQKLTKEGK